MATPIGIKFAQQVRLFREKQGLTQERLAELSKTNYKYIQRIESKTPPDIRLTTVEKLAKALKTSIKDLLDF